MEAETVAERMTVGDNKGEFVADDKITIQLTDGAPVRIVTANWPILTQAFMPIYTLNPHVEDCGLFEAIKREMSNVMEEAIDILGHLHVVIRKHADGRTLLYARTGSNVAEQCTVGLGGALLRPEEELAGAIGQYAGRFISMFGGCSVDAPRKLLEACLAGLPPENLDDDKTVKNDSEVIVLMGGRAVQVSRAEWPSISEVKTPLSCSFREPWNMPENGVFYSLKTFGHESLVVKSHHDGVSIVYGYRHYGGEQENKRLATFNIFNPRGGEIVAAGDDLPAAIKRVGTALGLLDLTIMSCVNGLPAQDLD
jgi:hypothetical protein